MSVHTPSMYGIELYQPVSELETPALVVDLDVMERNVRDFVEFAETNDVRLRSHAKAHKIPEIARWQDELTGGGVLCQKLSEAIVMAQHGLDDIYLSYMVVEESKLDRLIWLSESISSFATTVDSRGNIDPLQDAAAKHDVTLDVVLEVDVGLQRTGVQPGEPAVELATYLADQPNLSVAGVMGYEGHVGYVRDDVTTAEAYQRECTAAMDLLAETVDAIEAAGIDVREVMAGSTATSKYSGTHSSVTEIHPGMYPFYDARLTQCMPEVEKPDCAMTVETTVISTPTPDRAVVDAGSKTMSLDIDQPPIPKDRDDISYESASEEHGWLDTSEASEPLNVGDRLRFIMPHICTTVNLHDVLIGSRNGRVEKVWDVLARGAIR